MKNKIRWLRISYWAGALGDFALAILALSPEMMEVPAYCYPMGLFAAVAFSWGVMLLLADREPVQRRWVLLPTILVGSLLLVAVVYAMYAGVLPLAGSRLLNLILYPAMIALWIFSYVNARELD
jgi:hypothetical protein